MFLKAFRNSMKKIPRSFLILRLAILTMISKSVGGLFSNYLLSKFRRRPRGLGKIAVKIRRLTKGQSFKKLFENQWLKAVH